MNGWLGVTKKTKKYRFSSWEDKRILFKNWTKLKLIEEKILDQNKTFLFIVMIQTGTGECLVRTMKSYLMKNLVMTLWSNTLLTLSTNQKSNQYKLKKSHLISKVLGRYKYHQSFLKIWCKMNDQINISLWNLSCLKKYLKMLIPK